MKNKVVNYLLEFIKKHKKCDERKLKIYKYGLEGLYNLVTKIIVITLITLTFGIIKEFLLILLFYAIIRTYAFGIHAESSLKCWISTLMIYILGSVVVHNFIIIKEVALFISFLGLLSFILWAPADTPKRPLIRKNQRKTQKIKTCIICIIYILLIIISRNQLIINAITYSLVIEMICINPLTYKLTKTTFNNYRFYKGLNCN